MLCISIFGRLKEIEDQFKKQQDEHEKNVSALKDKEQKIEIADSRLKELDKKLNEQVAVLKQKLESVAHMSDQEAKRELISALEDEAKAEAAKLL